MLNWHSLTKEERREYMQIQMSPSGGYDRSGYLPDDCGYCGACGNPILGTGWCSHCSARYAELRRKLENETY
jgi:hypothetical protein